MSDPELNECPKCGSQEVSGLVGSFYAPIDRDGELEGQWSDYQSSTELTGEKMCRKCDHEWED